MIFTEQMLVLYDFMDINDIKVIFVGSSDIVLVFRFNLVIFLWMLLCNFVILPKFKGVHYPHTFIKNVFKNSRKNDFYFKTSVFFTSMAALNSSEVRKLLVNA